MERLEDMVLAKILGFVPKNDQLKLFLVSKRWYRIMDECVGIDVTISSGTSSHWNNPVYESTRILEKFGIRSCELNSFIKDSTVLPKLKHPDLLKFITLKDFVSSTTLDSILTGVTSLHTFEIDHPSICHLEFSKITLSLACLTLSIRYGDTKLNQRNDVTVNQILSINTIHLLRKFFPGLKKLDVFLSISKHTYEMVTEELEYFLNSHAESLRTVFINLSETWSASLEDELIVPPLPEKQERKKDSQFKNLKRLRISISSFTKLSTNWMEWALNTGHLETVYLRCELSQSLFGSIISKNKSLKELDISWTFRDPDSSFDCAMLKNCNKLTDLSIWGNINVPVVEGLLKVYELPTSIARLLISGVPVTCETCNRIFMQLLSRLEELTLVDNLDSLGYGVSEFVPNNIILQKKLKRFRIDAGSGTPGYCDYLASAYKVNQRQISGILQKSGSYLLQISDRQTGSVQTSLV